MVKPSAAPMRAAMKSRRDPVSPSDLAATVFKFLEIDLESHWTSPQGRPVPIVTESGKPIHELFG